MGGVCALPALTTSPIWANTTPTRVARGTGGALVTVPARWFGLLCGAPEGPSPSARLAVVLAVGLCGLGGAPALAQGPGPEKPPISAPPPRLAPEPAPAPRSSVSQSSSTTQPRTTSNTTRPTARASKESGANFTLGAGESSSRATRSQSRSSSPPRSRPTSQRMTAQPDATKAAKRLSREIERDVTRIAVGATTPGASGSNRLLLLGGLALLLLALSDAVFLALSAGFLRDRKR